MACAEPVWPGRSWETATCAQAGMDEGRLRQMAALVGGRGCVVRGGKMVLTWGDVTQRADVASAAKPLYAHFLWVALEEGKVGGLDEAVVGREPRLGELNAGLGHKDRGITWRHLATQTSCYGVSEAPGTAYDYNDWQMALFWDLLFCRVWGASAETVDAQVLRPLLTDVLGCEDAPTMLAFGTQDRAGRLAISVRDFARFGLLYLRGGQWAGRQVISGEHAWQAVSSPLPNSIPQSAGVAAGMLPGQRTIGSKVVADNQTDHLGSYSFLWWVNGVDRQGRRMWPGAPEDAFAALGHGGRRALFVIPSLDVVVSWNEAKDEGHAMQDGALKLVVEACGARQ